MKDARQILAFVIDSIAHVYRRPLMYGGDADGVECVIWTYHAVWSEIVDRRGWMEIVREIGIRQGHGPLSAARYFRAHVPGGRDATESEAVGYVVAHWKAIDEALGLVVAEAP